MSIETIEYSVCQDCLMFIAYGGEECDDGTSSHILQAIEREVAGREAHFVTGIAPTEDDPDGNGYKEFSHQECELCRSKLGGGRHGATLVVRLDGQENVKRKP